MGPKRCGKTRIANFLAGHETNPGSFDTYKPTKGTRILECEKAVQAGKKSLKLQVELWDCSGDRQYENCWTAILRDAQGVILCYDPTIKEQEKDIELWHKTFVAPLHLGEGQIMVFAHQSQVGGATYQPPRSFDRMRFLNTTLDSDDSKEAMEENFVSFLGAVGVAASEKSSADMDAQLQAVG
jgi:Rab-like protein 5